ncbi:Tyrosine-protein kinase RYK [Lamellibrachia satsuma]|nr:Tyrosine-protein kinase RYK [Lamellibrachia satsuma]
MERLLLVAATFVCCTQLAVSNFDLYMNETETLRLLGVPGQLYYVRNGIVNHYALSFSIPVKSDIDDIYFVWQNLRKSPPAPSMFYKMAVTVSNSQAMNPPQTSLPKEGVVPTSLTVFRITMPCSGLLPMEVTLHIQMNISIFSASNLTVLNIRRRKTCLRDGFQLTDSKHRIIPVRQQNVSYVFPSRTRTSTAASTSVFYISVGCACGGILLVAIAIAIYYVRLQKSSGEHLSEANSAQGLTHAQTYLRADTPNNSVSGLSGVRKAFSTPVPMATEITPSTIHALLTQISIERSRVSLGEIIMEGAFGKIYRGVLVGENENELQSEQMVYVKTVSEEARRDQRELVMREACLLKGLSHPNVNPILAACIDDERHPLLIFSFANQGNLKKFLQRCKLSEIGAHQALTTQQLVYIAIQITRGLQYLHRRRIVHGDVATRNCIVDTNLSVKVTDNALARDLFPSDYHCLGDNENRPIKWLALESLTERRFSPASDVWAFGIVLWELMTLGQQPYAEIDPFEMTAYLKEGFRIAQPINCPDELFAVMACCWALSLDERPKLSQLQICLQEFYTALGRFI